MEPLSTDLEQLRCRYLHEMANGGFGLTPITMLSRFANLLLKLPSAINFNVDSKLKQER
jgi:hypothetical protein